jgi:hypothetical protein
MWSIRSVTHLTAWSLPLTSIILSHTRSHPEMPSVMRASEGAPMTALAVATSAELHRVYRTWESPCRCFKAFLLCASTNLSRGCDFTQSSLIADFTKKKKRNKSAKRGRTG